MSWPAALLVYFHFFLPHDPTRGYTNPLRRWKEMKTTTAAIFVTFTVTLTLTHITVPLVSAKPDLTLSRAGKMTIKSATWEAADDNCLAKGDNLMVATSQNMDSSYRTLFESASNASNSLFWIGGYVTFSSWKWADGATFYTKKGCFHEGETGSTKGGRYMGKANGPELCFHVCENTTIISLGDEICFCVEDLSEVIRVPPRRCSKPCWKIRDQRCGGDEANSMYERDPLVPHFAFWESADPESCASLVVESNGRRYLTSANCSTKHGFICKLEQIAADVNDSRHVCYSLRDYGMLQMSWREARDLCEENGGHILPRFLPDYRMCPLHPGTYWIGLTREMHWSWIDGSDVGGQVQDNFGGRCLAAKVLRNSRITFFARNCSERLPYICRNDYQTIVTQSRVSSMFAKFKPDHSRATTLIYMSYAGNNTKGVGTTRSKQYDNTKDDVFVTIGAAVAICVLFMAAVLIIRCVVKKKKALRAKRVGYKAEVNSIEDLEEHISNVEEKKSKNGVKVHVNTHTPKPVHRNIHTSSGVTTI